MEWVLQRLVPPEHKNIKKYEGFIDKMNEFGEMFLIGSCFIGLSLAYNHPVNTSQGSTNSSGGIADPQAAPFSFKTWMEVDAYVSLGLFVFLIFLKIVTNQQKN